MFQGTYSSGEIHQSWKILVLQPPHWECFATIDTVREESKARIECSTHGQPQPHVHWVLNAELIKSGKGIKATG